VFALAKEGVTRQGIRAAVACPLQGLLLFLRSKNNNKPCCAFFLPCKGNATAARIPCLLLLRLLPAT